MRFLGTYLLASSVIAHPSSNTEPCRHRNAISRLSNYLISKIYGPPSLDVAVYASARSKKLETTATHGQHDTLLRFLIDSEEDATALKSAVDTLFLDVWDANRAWADVRVANDVVPSLLGLLPESLVNNHAQMIRNITREVQESMVSEAISRDTQFGPFRGTRHEPSRRAESKRRPDETNIFFSDYQPLSVIVPWMRLMQSLFATHVTLIDIGRSFEGRSILGLKVGIHPRNAETPEANRKTILITGGSHAREWISVSSVTYAAYALIIEYGKGKSMNKLIEEFDWVFIPTINPDGYVKTWEHDRLWRKNTQETNVPFCQGYDIDKSFPFEWDGDATRGNPCSESYAGDMPLQAVEALRLANWVKNETSNNNVTFVSFLDLHSYSQQILYPYAYSCVQTPPTLENLEELGLGLAKAIHQHRGDLYGVTSACEGSVSALEKTNRTAWPTVESNGGSALDWMYHEVGTKYAFQIKLPDTGGHGFLLPRKYIVPTGQDVFSAVSYLGHYLLSNKGVESIGPDIPRKLVEPTTKDVIVKASKQEVIETQGEELLSTQQEKIDLK